MTSPIPAAERLRIRIFVDFWNFSLSLKRENSAFMTDWRLVGSLLTAEAGILADPQTVAKFEGMHVYGSFDPAKPQDAKLRHWFTNTLDKMTGIDGTLLERKPKRGYPKCPACHTEATECNACQADMRGTEEKGVDTRIATDLIRLAWEDAFDVAVLVSSDADFVPVAEFLQTKGIKVIHGAFPPRGIHLSQKCWANLSLIPLMPRFERAPKPTKAPALEAVPITSIPVPLTPRAPKG